MVTGKWEMVSRKWSQFWARRLLELYLKVESNLLRAVRVSGGRRVAIVGPPGSGKTSIWAFLNSGGTRFITDHAPTLGAERVAGGVHVLHRGSALSDGLKFTLADSKDVSGDVENYPELWRQVIGDAFLVIFLFDVSRFVGIRDGANSKGYRNQVIEDAKFAGARIQHGDTIVVLAVGWCDKLKGWSPGNSAPLQECLTEYGDEIGKIRAKLGVNTRHKPRQVEGSLGTPEYAHDFIYRIFKEGTRGKG